MKPLIVGEAPGKGGDPSTPCEGRVGMRLATCAGIAYDEYLDLFDRTNLLDVQPQDSGKGTHFNVRAARRTAQGIVDGLTPGRIVLILGKRAASAFGLTRVAYFEWFALNRAKAVVVPHPSGVSRWWNDVANEAEMIKFMHSVMKDFR